jgi:hypothetical protein
VLARIANVTSWKSLAVVDDDDDEDGPMSHGCPARAAAARSWALQEDQGAAFK